MCFKTMNETAKIYELSFINDEVHRWGKLHIHAVQVISLSCWYISAMLKNMEKIASYEELSHGKTIYFESYFSYECKREWNFWLLYQPPISIKLNLKSLNFDLPIASDQLPTTYF